MPTRPQRRERASRLSDALVEAAYRTAPALARRGERWLVRRIEGLTVEARRARSRAGDLTPTKGTKRTLASADHIVALLGALRRPGTLPRTMRSSWTADTAREIARLVLHRVLEIEAEAGFVSGAAAASTIFRPARRGRLTDRDAPDVSRAALRYAAELPLLDGDELALRLYGYNRIPPQPLWRQRLATPAAVATWLGLDRGRLQTLLTRHWLGKLEPASGEVWLFWTPRTPSAHDPSAATHYKLYVSVAPARAPSALAHTVQSLVETGPTPFKIAADAHGFFRPDKLVVYFDSWPRLSAFASTLAPRLDGLAPHPVPFTAVIDTAARLSWGVDFPAQVNLVKAGDSESWRMWVSQRLARAIREARRERLTTEASAQFALDWLWLDGVDPQTWAPDESLLTDLARA